MNGTRGVMSLAKIRVIFGVPKNMVVEDGSELDECMRLEAKATIVGSIIAVISAIVSLIGILMENIYVVLVGHTGLCISLGVIYAFDLARKLGDKLIKRR